MDLREFLGVIWRWKYLIILVTIVAGGTVAYLGFRSPDNYSSEVSMVVGLDEISVISPNAVAVVQSGERLSATYAELIQSTEVLQRVIDDTGVFTSATALRARLTTTTVRNTPVLKVTVTDADPEKSRLAANAIAETFVDYVNELATRSIDNSRKALEDEIEAVNTELSALGTGPSENAGKIAALDVRREALINQYGEIVNRGRSGDISITVSAATATRISSGMTTKVALAVLIGLAGGVALAFLAEGIRKAMALPEE